MSSLGQVVSAVRGYRRHVQEEIRRVRSDANYAEKIMAQWAEIKSRIGVTLTPTGLELPRLALPPYDEPGEILRYLLEEGLPGQFPFTAAAYPEQYLEPIQSRDDVVGPMPPATREKPTRLFAGLGLPEDTNERFHYLSRNQRSK